MCIDDVPHPTGTNPATEIILHQLMTLCHVVSQGVEKVVLCATAYWMYTLYKVGPGPNNMGHGK